MAKEKSIWACTACGAQSAKWLGRCGTCGGWNTLEEERVLPASSRAAPTSALRNAKPQRIADVSTEDAARLPTGIGELDRALGGGPVGGGVILLGGDPGIGKSTLLMQMLAGLSAAGHSAVYVTGEESMAQVALRARRIGGAKMDNILLLATSELDEAASLLETEKPAVAVIDSIQTLRSSALSSAPGSVVQIREVAVRLIDLAKRHGIALFLIGHVTKEGTLAGPKVLEHLVDTVLSFEGDRSHAFRVVRAIKNRFGPAQEMGVFEMEQDGLREVPDPSALFLAERPAGASGSVVVPTAEGSRPLLVEIQALVATAQYGAARRVVSGLDSSRLAILLAVLDRAAKVSLLDRDIFASIAGGVSVDERALDLGLAVAVASSGLSRAVPADVAVFGEVGLAGEVRAVPRPGQRVAEARKLGFRKLVMPTINAERLTAAEREGIQVIAVGNVRDALSAIFGSSSKS